MEKLHVKFFDLLPDYDSGKTTQEKFFKQVSELFEKESSANVEILINDFKKEQLPNAKVPFHYEAEIAAGLEHFIKWLKNKNENVKK